jgi:MoaA/NifB/PqqE/SkfB family radical SAM enzyme
MNAEHLLRKQPHLKLWLSRIVSNPKLVNNPYYQNVEKALVRWKSKLYEKKPPWQVHIENTNYCNARCVMCPNPTMEREKAFMTDQVYEKAIDDVVDLGTHRVNLQSIGEPLLDKKFVDRLRLAKKFGLEVATSSNGSTLTERISQELVEARLDELNVSIDGYKSKTCNDIRWG